LHAEAQYCVFFFFNFSYNSIPVIGAQLLKANVLVFSEVNVFVQKSLDQCVRAKLCKKYQLYYWFWKIQENCVIIKGHMVKIWFF